MLPISVQDGRFHPFLDALFMATSAVSTTGLGVVAVGQYYTLFGQFIILILVQIGGLGYMTLILFIIYLFGQSVSYHSGHLMEESLALPSRGDMRDFVVRVVKLTLLFELVGAVGLTLFWMQEFSFWRALYYGVFHAISAFCTAGFALFPDGFVAYQDNAFFNLTINVISIAGAIGFFVLAETYGVLTRIMQRLRSPRKRSFANKPMRLSLHSKLSVWVTLALFLLGTAVLLLTNLRPTTMTGYTAVSTAIFQSLSAVSTTGFNTVDISLLSSTSLIMLTTLMFIGAPTGGTGGGIKSTTFGVIMLLVWAVLKSELDVNAFGRRIPRDTLIKSVAIAVTAVFWLVITVTILTATEKNVPFLTILFETSSALGTVGLSAGLTPLLSSIGKLLFIMTMFIGRVGPLTFMFSLFGQQEGKEYRYPQEEVFVG